MNYRHTIFTFFLFLAFSCQDDDQINANPDQSKKPMPEGSRKVNIVVDKDYDLSNTIAHSILDSMSMDGDDQGIYAPKDFESAVLFLDNVSGEILAVVRTDTVSNDVKVNAQSVAEALLTAVPAYQALSAEREQRFKQEARSSQPYKDFVLIIDAFLKSKKPIYSTDPEFILKVLDLNSYILTNYLGSPNLEGGRLATGCCRIIPSFPHWLKRENGGTLHQWVSSYMYVEFAPLNGGEPVTTILDPLPLDPKWAYTTPLSTLKLNDNCYTVQLNQTHQSVRQKNQLAIATNVTGMFLGVMFGAIGDNDMNDCTASIALSIVGDISTTVMGAANISSLDDILSATLGTAKNAILAAYSSKACRAVAIERGPIAALLSTQLIYFKALIAAAGTAYSLVEITPYIVALIDPVDLKEIIQLHEGKLKEACVEVVKEGALKEEYGPGETIYPEIKLIPQSQYAEWEKAGFKVNWVVKSGNGSVNTANSTTSAEGKAIVGWTLPNNMSGLATLTAEIKDKEGDHLAGSPLEFKVKVTNPWPEKLIGEWKMMEHHVWDDEMYQIYATQEANGTYYETIGNNTYRFTSYYTLTIREDFTLTVLYHVWNGGTQEPWKMRWSVSPKGYFSSDLRSLFTGQLEEVSPTEFIIHTMETCGGSCIRVYATLTKQ